jgi:hypothetical protein
MPNNNTIPHCLNSSKLQSEHSRNRDKTDTSNTHILVKGEKQNNIDDIDFLHIAK